METKYTGLAYTGRKFVSRRGLVYRELCNGTVEVTYPEGDTQEYEVSLRIVHESYGYGEITFERRAILQKLYGE